MGPPELWKNTDFRGPPNWPFWALFGPFRVPGPRKSDSPYLFLYPESWGYFLDLISAISEPFLVFAPGKHVPETHPKGAPGAPWEAPRPAPGPPGPSRTPPGAIRKVVPEDAKNSGGGAPGHPGAPGGLPGPQGGPPGAPGGVPGAPGAPPTLFVASSGTTFRIAPGGVREGPGGLGAAWGAAQGAPRALLGWCPGR